MLRVYLSSSLNANSEELALSFYLVLHCVKTEWDRCACAERGQWGRGDVQPEPIVGVSFTDWPPFTGCWHACYIKETPPTAAPDNLQHWHRPRGREKKALPSKLLFASLARETFPGWSCVEFSAFVLPSSVWEDTDSAHSFLLTLCSAVLDDMLFRLDVQG